MNLFVTGKEQMMQSHWEYAVKNQLDIVIGAPEKDKRAAELWRDQNQRIANRVGDRDSRYRVVKRRVSVGRWIDT